MEQMSFVIVYYAAVVILWPIKLTQIYSYLTQGRLQYTALKQMFCAQIHSWHIL